MNKIMNLFRQTGRTMQMLQHAVNVAYEKPVVIIVVSSQDKLRLIRIIDKIIKEKKERNICIPRKNIVIRVFNPLKNDFSLDKHKFESSSEFSEIYRDPNQIFVDHSVYEYKYHDVLTNLFKYTTSMRVIE